MTSGSEQMRQSQDAPQIAVWSTASVSEAEAVDYWRDAVCDVYVKLSTTPSTRVFWGEVTHARYVDFELSAIRASGERVRRSKALIARSCETTDCLYATIHVAGRGVLEQAGQTVALTPGVVTFYETSQPFSLSFDGAWEQVIVHVPADRIYTMAGLRRSDDLLAVPFNSSAAAAPVAAFFKSLNAAQLRDPGGAAALAPHATGLLASLLGTRANRDAPAALPDFVRREQVIAFLRSHMGDPGLDVEAIARGCLISRRALYRLFEGTESSVMGRLRQLRVQTAILMLCNQPNRSVSAIGQACGFGTDAQFYRAFREVTALTPAAYRSLASRVAATEPIGRPI